MDEKKVYREQLDRVQFRPDFESAAAELMRRAAEKKEKQPMITRKSVKIIIAAAAALALLTTTVFAISALLSPQDVASRIDGEIARAFQSEDAVELNQTATVGDYEFTLLGIASGSRLEFLGDLPEENSHSYVVMAVSRLDGSPIDPAETLSAPSGKMLTLSPLVEGWAPHHVNAWSLCCAGHEITVDGVRYCLFDYTNLELFADRTVYMAVYEGLAPSAEVFTMNEDGTIVFAEGYSGEKGLFTLPVDPSRADAQAALQLLIDQGILGEDGQPVGEDEQSSSDEYEYTETTVEVTGEVEYSTTTGTVVVDLNGEDFYSQVTDDLYFEVQLVTGN